MTNFRECKLRKTGLFCVVKLFVAVYFSGGDVVHEEGNLTRICSGY